MPGKYSAVEICRIGAQLELNGHLFYTKAANITTDLEFKEVLLRLAQDELEHERAYRRIMKELEKEDPETCCFDQEYYDYIQSVADRRILTDEAGIEKLISQMSGPIEFLETAMKFEENAIFFFTEIKRFVRAPDVALLDQFIQYEKDHWNILNERREKLLADR